MRRIALFCYCAALCGTFRISARPRGVGVMRTISGSRKHIRISPVLGSARCRIKPSPDAGSGDELRF